MSPKKHAHLTQAVADGRLLYTGTATDRLAEALRRRPPAMVANAATKIRSARTRTNGNRAPGKQDEAGSVAPTREALAVLSRRGGLPKHVGPMQPTSGRDSNPVAAGTTTSNRVQHGGGASTWNAGGTSTGRGIAPSGKSRRFIVEDTAGTRQAIQHVWKEGMQKKDVLSACARIDAFLDNPLFAGDKERAAVTLQSVARGWLLRRARKAGAALFPVEAQALADGRVLMHKGYGGRVYSLSPSQRRSLIRELFAAQAIQRVMRVHWSKARARLQAEDSCIFLAPEDSLLNVAADALLPDLDLKALSYPQDNAVAATQVLQRAIRMHAARKCCHKMRLRLSTAVSFLGFLSTDLAAASRTDAARIHLEDAAAVRVQSFWRGASCRHRLKGKLGVRIRAAILLQRHVRGWTSRRRFGLEQSRRLHRLVLKRVLRWWNKIMWTVYSPGKVGRENLNDDGEDAARAERWFGEAGAEASDAHEMVSGAQTSAHAAAAPAATARPIASAQVDCVGDEDSGGQVSSYQWAQAMEESDGVLGASDNDTPRQSQKDTPRQSGEVAWQIVESASAGRGESSEPESWSLAPGNARGAPNAEGGHVEGLGSGVQPPGGCHGHGCTAAQERKERKASAADGSHSRRASQNAGEGGLHHLDLTYRNHCEAQWPATYSNSICIEAGALKQGKAVRVTCEADAVKSDILPSCVMR